MASEAVISEQTTAEAIIDVATYVPPPPSEEQKKKISKLYMQRYMQMARTHCSLMKGKLVLKTFMLHYPPQPHVYIHRCQLALKRRSPQIPKTKDGSSSSLNLEREKDW